MTHLTSRNFARRLLAVVPALALLSAGAALPSRATADAVTAATPGASQSTPAAAQNPAITGFRGATFGMTEAQVRRVILSAFKVPASATTASTNAIQRTTILSVRVPDLIPGGGSANVSYVFGYESHKLIQIDVLWSQDTDPKMTAAQLDQNGQSLQQYFATEGFQHATGGIATGNGILLFRAYDPTGNAVLLILSGTLTKDQKSPDKSVLTPTALTLDYAADALHPDVFQLPKGSF